MDDINDLVDQGYSALKNGEYDEAIKIGEELKKKRHSSGFEILAHVYSAKDEIKQAIEILKEGVSVAPTVWILWEMLGNLYSDLKQFKEAYSSYEKGLECVDAVIPSVLLNYAMALFRDRKNREALDRLNQIENPSIGTNYEEMYYATKTGVLNALMMYPETIETSSQFLDNIAQTISGEFETGDGSLALTNILAEKAYAIWKSTGNQKKAELLLKSGLANHRQNQRARWVLREIRNQKAEASRHLQILIAGEWPWPSEDGEELNFMANFDVVAENENEALDFIKDFEPEKTWKSLQIRECKTIGKTPNEPKGVYNVTGHILYPRKDDEKKAGK